MNAYTDIKAQIHMHTHKRTYRYYRQVYVQTDRQTGRQGCVLRMMSLHIVLLVPCTR